MVSERKIYHELIGHPEYIPIGSRTSKDPDSYGGYSITIFIKPSQNNRIYYLAQENKMEKNEPGDVLKTGVDDFIKWVHKTFANELNMSLDVGD